MGEVDADPARIVVCVQGSVQGVGFRPYVYRLARELGLAGVVYNDGRGATIEVEGAPARMARFLERLRAELPPLARIDDLTVEEVAALGEDGFTIGDSAAARGEPTPITADAATCAACLAELFDPADRRYRYPFINCTDCGPRFTIVVATPYDRARTTMARFRMCAACQAEYDDPRSRRFHAQPNACAACGPRVALTQAQGRDGTADGFPAPGGAPAIEADAAIAGAVRLLCDGAIVAVKGIGGFHLACRADDEAAVARLRARKRREERPFALMARDAAAAANLIEVGAGTRALLTASARPIVLAPRKAHAAVAPSVAPGAHELGVMLPYSPLHHLLLADAGVVLVMTSGNVSDEPIAHENRDAFDRLAAIADAFLTHDRPIHIRTDDSVVRARDADAAGPAVFVRRSRGWVPGALTLPVEAPPLLAVGGEQKNTFCVARGTHAWLSHHVGDLENWSTLRSFEDGIAHFERLFRIAPEVLAHDLHPEYLSTKYACDRAGSVPLLGVQHHHAHFAACLAEHGVTGRAIGVIYDGTGHGPDGTVWGGELLVGDIGRFERAGHLRQVRLPGGAGAIREPWRMACAWAVELGADDGVPVRLAGRVEPGRWEAVARLAGTGLASPTTSSVGRLFDAVAALCGVRPTVTYEGQAAIELERIADPREPDAYAFRIDAGPPLTLDPAPALHRITEDLARGAAAATVAGRFHNALAAATVQACGMLAERTGLRTVVLSGGVFQNVLLAERVRAGLSRAGLKVLVPERMPCNDGGLAYGQAAVVAAAVRP